MGLRRKSKPKTPPTFGEKGTLGVAYLGDLPYQHRGCYTGHLYVWNKRHPSLWIDKRDVPGLVKAIGRELLDGVPDKPTRKRKPAKVEVVAEDQPVETEPEQAKEPEVE